MFFFPKCELQNKQIHGIHTLIGSNIQLNFYEIINLKKKIDNNNNLSSLKYSMALFFNTQYVPESGELLNDCDYPKSYNICECVHESNGIY